jgi:hypothetical protein
MRVSSEVQEKRTSVLLDIAHRVQQLACLLKPLPRSSRVSIYAKVIFTNFCRGESVYSSNFLDTVIVFDAMSRDDVSERCKIQGAEVMPGKEVDEDKQGTRRHTQILPSSASGHPLAHLPESNAFSCPMQGETRRQS